MSLFGVIYHPHNVQEILLKFVLNSSSLSSCRCMLDKNTAFDVLHKMSTLFQGIICLSTKEIVFSESKLMMNSKKLMISCKNI